MEWFEALVLGLVQGLTEYLPVSSSGHLAIGAHLFGLNGEENLAFTVAVHVATVLSTCVILWREIVWLFQDLFKWKWNEGTKYVVNILISMIPVAIVGFFFKDKVEAIFGSGLLVVGICLLITASLLPGTPSSSVSPRLSPSCRVSPARAAPSPPVSCWATRRRNWPSSHSSWSSLPFWVKPCSTSKTWPRWA